MATSIKISTLSFTPKTWDESDFPWDSDLANDIWDEFGVCSFLLEIGETVNIKDVCGKSLTRGFTESFAISDSTFRNINKNSLENLAVSDVLNTKARFMLYAEEFANINSNLSKYSSFSKKEQVKFVDEYYRACEAVISDIAFYNVALSVDEIASKDTPAGYAPFKEFIAGDWVYKDAIFKIALEAKTTEVKPVITEWKLNIDVPDVFDKGILEIPAEENFRVDFARRFWDIPDVTIKIRSDENIHVADLITDKTGFNITLKNSSGEISKSLIYWKAEGY